MEATAEEAQFKIEVLEEAANATPDSGNSIKIEAAPKKDVKKKGKKEKKKGRGRVVQAPKVCAFAMGYALAIHTWVIQPPDGWNTHL